MTDTQPANLEVGHPAPQRHHAAPATVLFALCGAPAVWLMQLLIGFATTSYVCFTGQAHVVLASVPGWLQPLVIAANLIALAIGLAALAAGIRLLRQTGEEHQERSGGVLDAGEGRTRFLAVIGLFGSAILGIAMLANTFALFMVPLCRT
jgi:hypothetical protein